MISSRDVKKAADKLGADLCGIAPVSRFEAAPEGFRPSDIYPPCQSVVVVAKRVPPAIFTSQSVSPYTMVYAERIMALNNLVVELSNWFYDHGAGAMPIPSSLPFDYWDATRMTGKGLLSLKHAAELAGLGRIGRNTLLVNKKYGNMISLGALLADAPLQPDKPVEQEYCIEGCRKCMEACPVRALDGIVADQKKCRQHTSHPNSHGDNMLLCSKCRNICPNMLGISSPKDKRPHTA